MSILGKLAGLGGLAFWSRVRGMKTARSVDVARAVAEQRARFNPLRSFTPEKLVRAIDAWRIGTICDLARILEELEQRDDMILACSRKMKSSVARCKHSVQVVEGQEDNPEAQRHKRALEDFYAGIRATSVFARNERGGFRLLVKQMMDAVHAKYAVHEIVWEPHRDGTLSARFQFVPLWMFENHTGELRYLDHYGAYDGVPMEPGGWLVTVGDGVGVAAAVAAMSKRLSMNDWLLFSEKCGTPGLHARTSAPEDSESWQKLVDALRNFGRDWSCVTDTETEISTVSLAQGGTTPYPDLVRFMNKAISVLYRGADLSTLSGEGGDASGASLQGAESDILEQDACEMLSETLQEQVDRFVIRYHFGEDAVPLAYIQIEPNAKQDAKLDMDVDRHLMEAGVCLSKNDMIRRYGRTEYKPEDKTDAPLTRQPSATGGNGPGLPSGAAALANEDSGARAGVEAWKSLRADLNGALSACEEAIRSRDADGFVAALKRLPKTADGTRLAQSLRERMKSALRLHNALEFDEGDHPRGRGGRFIAKEGEGRTIETFAYGREGRRFKLDRNGNHVYGPEAVEDRFSFGKRFDAAKKDKPTPNFDRNRAVPDSGRRTFGEMDARDYFTRDDSPIDYGEAERPDGKPRYVWRLDGKPLTERDAAELEAACAEGISGQLLTPETTGVRVRRDYANGRNQVAQFVGGTGRRKTIYDRETERHRQQAKFAQVDSVVENYDRLFGEIASDAEGGSYEANVAYFLTRSKCRVGGKRGRGSDNFGALDLTGDNIRVSGDTVTLDFDAKNSHWRQTIRDRRLATWMSERLREAKPGEPVLGGAHTTPGKVNDYLTGVGERCGIARNADGKGLTAHNIRHAGATRLASELVDGIGIDPSEDRRGYVAALADVVRTCGRHIGDTGKLAFEKYISPKYLFKNAPDLLAADAAYRMANENWYNGDMKTGKPTNEPPPNAPDVEPLDDDDEDDDPSFYTEADYERFPVLRELREMLEED